MIVIHIGFPKAGSTTIQSYLDLNEKALRASSIDFPTAGRARRAHHKIAHELSGRADKVNRDVGRVSDLANHIASSSFNTTILSSECFTPFTSPMIYRVAQALSEIDQVFRIVQVIRPLVDLAASSYAQRTRFGGLTYDFDQFFELLLSRDKFNALEVASRWAEVFGWDALRVRALDPPQLINGDLIDDFLVAADLDPDEPVLRALPRPPRANESTGWKALEAIRALFSGHSGLAASHPLVQRVVLAGDKRSHRRRIGAAAEDVAAENGWAQERGRYLTRPQAERLNEDYAAAIVRLNERLVVKLRAPLDLEARGFVERPFLPSVKEIAPEELRLFYDTVFARLEYNDSIRVKNKRKMFQDDSDEVLDALHIDSR